MKSTACVAVGVVAVVVTVALAAVENQLALILSFSLGRRVLVGIYVAMMC